LPILELFFRFSYFLVFGWFLFDLIINLSILSHL